LEDFISIHQKAEEEDRMKVGKTNSGNKTLRRNSPLRLITEDDDNVASSYPCSEFVFNTVTFPQMFCPEGKFPCSVSAQILSPC